MARESLDGLYAHIALHHLHLPVWTEQGDFFEPVFDPVAEGSLYLVAHVCWGVSRVWRKSPEVVDGRTPFHHSRCRDDYAGSSCHNLVSVARVGDWIEVF